MEGGERAEGIAAVLARRRGDAQPLRVLLRACLHAWLQWALNRFERHQNGRFSPSYDTDDDWD